MHMSEFCVQPCSAFVAMGCMVAHYLGQLIVPAHTYRPMAFNHTISTTPGCHKHICCQSIISKSSFGVALASITSGVNFYIAIITSSATKMHCHMSNLNSYPCMWIRSPCRHEHPFVTSSSNKMHCQKWDLHSCPHQWTPLRLASATSKCNQKALSEVI